MYFYYWSWLCASDPEMIIGWNQSLYSVMQSDRNIFFLDVILDISLSLSWQIGMKTAF